MKVCKVNLAKRGSNMNKDEILRMSREENEGRHDERELRAFGTASRIGMATGALLCTLLAVASKLLDVPEIGLAGWMVYFGMFGAGYLALYRELRRRRDLVWGVVDLVIALAFAVAMVVVSMV